MKERYFSVFELFLIASFSALIVVGKIALRLPLQLSGHSGLFWMAIIIVSARVIPKKGAVSLVGITSGIIAAFIGMGDLGALNTLVSYSMVGIGTEAALLLLGDPERFSSAIPAAVFGHLCKFFVKWLFGVVSGAPVGFIALGLAKAIAGSLLFGALGGLLGAVTLRALRGAGFFDYLSEKK